MPANVRALVMKAAPGAELACKTLTYSFPHEGDRGAITYYAVHALGGATTMGSWLQRIQARSSEDQRRGTFPSLNLPALQVVGPAAARLPGTPF